MWRAFDNRRRTKVDRGIDVPVGFILPTALGTTSVPSGWLVCNGAAVTSIWPDLRAFLIALGSPFGTSGPDPLLPDMRGRKAVGVGTHASVSAVGASDGLTVASRTPKHLHSVPGHQHTVPSHNHSYGAHQHSSPSHTHTAESHTHSSPSHGHTVSGTSGAATDGEATVDFGGATDRISFFAHNHGNGSLAGDQQVPGQTGAGGSAATTGPVSQQNGGLTGSSSATNTGSSSDTLDPSAASNTSTDSMPFQTGHYMIKAVA